MKDILTTHALLPSTTEEFLRGITEIHYVDVGLNCRGAYQTDAHVLEGLATAARAREGGLLVYFHGTPRQWCDGNRRWVLEEKNQCRDCLVDAAARHGPGAKLRVADKMYFGEKLGQNFRRPNLQMHFEIIEALTVSPS